MGGPSDYKYCKVGLMFLEMRLHQVKLGLFRFVEDLLRPTFLPRLPQALFLPFFDLKAMQEQPHLL